MNSGSVTALFASAAANFLSIYLILIFVRILLSWFPNVNWSNPFFSILSQLTDPYLNIFRSIIPPLGGIDLSPILGILLLQVVAGVLQGFSGSSSLLGF